MEDPAVLNSKSSRLGLAKKGAAIGALLGVLVTLLAYYLITNDSIYRDNHYNWEIAMVAGEVFIPAHALWIKFGGTWYFGLPPKVPHLCFTLVFNGLVMAFGGAVLGFIASGNLTKRLKP